MKKLDIEWLHYAKEGQTCDRCAATGIAAKEVVEELTRELSGRGISVSFTETVLPENLMAHSNMILLNGVPLEEVLGNATAAENSCPSCSCLTGSDTSCRTVEQDGVVYEEIPAALFRQAALKALGITTR